MAETAVRVRVTGRVQGVWFRGWTQAAARRLGVRGWVRNAADGSVEAHLEGAPGAVEALLAALWQGPEAARVTGVEVAEAAPGGPADFRIRR
jgi:acylphosphatase